MSIFDELLILIDDQKRLNTEQIADFMPQYTRQAIGSTLGRLTGREWLYRSDTGYQLAPGGNEYLGSTLQSIKRGEKTWDGSWYSLVVTMPESQRKQRDMLRHYLTDRGFGRLVDGYWISPWERQEEATHVIRKLGLSTSVLTFKTQPFGKATVQLVIQQAWDWQKVTNGFQDFFKAMTFGVQKLEQAVDEGIYPARIRHQAQSLVFSYAQHMTGDPNLPLSITPNNEDYKKARELYERARAYCYFQSN